MPHGDHAHADHPQADHPQAGHPQAGHPQAGHPQAGHAQPGHPVPAAPRNRAGALREAEDACARRGAQLTPLRRRVLEMVLEADQPVGAYALLDRLRAERPGAAPPTVYRALDFLMAQGLIHKVERLNAFTPCSLHAGSHGAGGHGAGDGAGHGEDHGHPHQFLICRNCGRTAELSDAPVADAVAAAARAAGFTPLRTTVEVEGTCGSCAGA